MSTAPLTLPADADSPDADRAGADASARMPEWLVHLIALIIRFILERSLAARARRAGLPSWWNYRADLPPGSVQQLAASIRGEFGNAIAWMCLRRGYGPGHKDWPYLSRTIVAFGGNLKRFRPGMPAWGLQWFENPHVLPGSFGEDPVTPAADALAALLARAELDVPTPARFVSYTAAVPALPPARPRRRGVSARAATGPPIGRSTGPPTGPPMWPPAWRPRPRLNLSCLTNGASRWLAPPSGFVLLATAAQPDVAPGIIEAQHSRPCVMARSAATKQSRSW